MIDKDSGVQSDTWLWSNVYRLYPHGVFAQRSFAPTGIGRLHDVGIIAQAARARCVYFDIGSSLCEVETGFDLSGIGGSVMAHVAFM